MQAIYNIELLGNEESTTSDEIKQKLSIANDGNKTKKINERIYFVFNSNKKYFYFHFILEIENLLFFY